MKSRTIILILLLHFSCIISDLNADNLMKIYIDADRTSSVSSGLSIEQGVRLALSEISYQINGSKIELIIKDHHGNSRRSTVHINEFIEDPDAIAMFCGLHSPPVLANLDLIQENDVLLLDPWAAAGQITRTPASDGDNWVFRLSVDDMKAGEVIASYACDTEAFRKPVLLLEDTGWGESNRRTMIDALEKRNIIPLKTLWFNWDIGVTGVKEILQDIYTLGSDVIFMVANTTEGSTFIKAMSERTPEERIPIRSHWGITGGNLFYQLGSEILVDKVDLKFIQTSFSFTSPNQSDFSKEILYRSSILFDEIAVAEDIKAPAGFIHAYDLTKIFISALKQAQISGGGPANRLKAKKALESLTEPVNGLVKTYIQPFSNYSKTNASAHEALDIDDLTMAHYSEKGSIILLKEVQ